MSAPAAVTVPDSTTWTDDAGQEWTAYGADVTAQGVHSWRGMEFKIEIETATPGIFLDVTDDYVSAQWATPFRTRYGAAWSPGGGQLVLKGESTEWFGSDTAAKVRPGRSVRITALHDPDNPEQQFVGWVGDVSTPVAPAMPPVTSIALYSSLTFLSKARREAVSAVGAGDDEGERIDRILDSAGWSSTLREYELAASPYTCVPATTLEGAVLDELNLLAVSFLGYLLEDVRTGNILYVSAYSRSIRRIQRDFWFLDPNPYSLDYGTYGVVEITEWTWDLTLANVINYASSAEVGGTPTVYEYADSQDAFGLSTWIRDDLICSSGVAPNVAYYMITHLAEPREYPSRVLVTEGEWRIVDAVLNADLLTTAQASYGNLNILNTIVGMRHEIAPAVHDAAPGGRSDTWRVEFLLDASDQYYTTPDTE